MKISIIYAVDKADLIYYEVHLLLKKLDIKSDIKVKEFFISKDIPLRSNFDYYSFFYDEQSYSDYYKPLKEIHYYLTKSDLIILVPSICSKNTNREIKNLVNHLSYSLMPHKNNHSMENTLAVILTPSASFSYRLQNLYFYRNFRFWGINKNSIFFENISKYPTNTIHISKLKQINDEMATIALKILNQYKETFSYNCKTAKNIHKKKALNFSKCLSTIKKVVHG